MRFRYTGDDAREFPDVRLSVAPGDVIDADDNPHPAYFEADASKSAQPTEE